MILYTIEPYARVFAAREMQTRTVQLECGLLEISQSPQGGTVSRLISTRPSDYLNQNYQPGSKV